VITTKMNLHNNEVHLYFAWPEQITDDGLLRRYRSLLSAEELTQMARFYYARHRHQFLITRTLIRTSLSAYYQVDPSAWQFGKNGFGKPKISHPDKTLPIHFNISHADGLNMCGLVRDHDIGVDVEDRQRSTRAALESLSSYFSRQEIEDLGKLPPDQQKQRFFDYWTLKESYIKARGAGLSIPLRKFSFHFQANTLSGFDIHPDLKDDADRWQFWRMPMADRYQVAVAINSPKKDLELIAFNSVPLQDTEPMALSFL
jgi:4'-phosphopantetheinyl transferase